MSDQLSRMPTRRAPVLALATGVLVAAVTGACSSPDRGAVAAPPSSTASLATQTSTGSAAGTSSTTGVTHAATATSAPASTGTRTSAAAGPTSSSTTPRRPSATRSPSAPVAPATSVAAGPSGAVAVQDSPTIQGTQLPPPTATQARTFVIPCQGDDPQQRPATMAGACGDSGSTLTKLSWTSWGGPTASASGIEQQNTCDPSCAGGKVVDYPVTVTLSKPVARGASQLYSILTVTYTGAVPDGTNRVQEFPLA